MFDAMRHAEEYFAQCLLKTLEANVIQNDIEWTSGARAGCELFRFWDSKLAPNSRAWMELYTRVEWRNDG